jgi:hypothetical protein
MLCVTSPRQNGVAARDSMLCSWRLLMTCIWLSIFSNRRRFALLLKCYRIKTHFVLYTCNECRDMGPANRMSCLQTAKVTGNPENCTQLFILCDRHRVLLQWSHLTEIKWPGHACRTSYIRGKEKLVQSFDWEILWCKTTLETVSERP